MADTTTRWGIVEPSADRSDPADVPLYVRNVTQALEALGTIYGQGTLASRPVSTPSTPGKIGRIYFATDNGLLYYDTGTNWIQVTSTYAGPADGSVGTTQLADNSVTLSKMADGSVGSAEIVDGSIASVDIADALKPSAGAGAGTETLRALGTAPGMAAAGVHAPQHLRTGADPLQVSPSPATTLPASPGDTQQAILVDSLTAPKYSWLMQYFQSAGCWICIGPGGWLEGGLTVTVPRAGDYMCEIGAQGLVAGAGSSYSVYSLNITAGGVSLAALAGQLGGQNNNDYSSPFDKGKMVGLTTGQVLTVSDGSSNTSGAIVATRRYIRIQPVRMT